MLELRAVNNLYSSSRQKSCMHFDPPEFSQRFSLVLMITKKVRLPPKFVSVAKIYFRATPFLTVGKNQEKIQNLRF